MPEFVDSTVKDIDEQLRQLRDEVSRLEAARSALTGGRRRPGRPRGSATRATRARTSRARSTHTQASRTRTGRRASTPSRTRSTRGARNTRAAQALIDASNTISQLENAYWNLVAAWRNVAIQEAALKEAAASIDSLLQ